MVPLLMKSKSSLRTEGLIVMTTILVIIMLPLLAIIGLTQNGLQTILTSVILPSAGYSLNSTNLNPGEKINKEALALAQKTRGFGKNIQDATIAYQQARIMTKADPSFQGASDCGEFVAVVVRMVYDSHYPLRDTNLQLSYVKRHPDLWQQLPDNLPVNFLKPGDIFINSLHTYIYTGLQPNGYNTVAASWGGYIPEPAMLFYSENGIPFQIFRAIN